MGSRRLSRCSLATAVCLVAIVVAVAAKGRDSKPSPACDPMHGALAGIFKELRTTYRSVRETLQTKDTVYYVSLFHEQLLQEMLSPVGCRVTNELMQHYLDGVLPRAFHCGYDNTTLNALHFLSSSLSTLYQHMLKCPALACTGQTPAWTQFLDTEHKLDPWKGTVKATAEMDLLLNYLETFLLQS
ncbi:interleukin-10 [Cercopithecine betaherpesvirus 5]|uniref:Viral interleukin-10 homolog n=1 Tax=Simian cytomegalovirus (strain Colburn) TaxID=50292 RepID=Q9ICJ0_SCMVC|nr:interleukin-10 [Cercopithecine betaherpesvirus 5]AAF63435.1 interleukin-10-like protein [Cercopithecine betaherpesvirus 5]AEV80459.1 interleukin-10 [Cercopithecine betaherpesvirus 5]